MVNAFIYQLYKEFLEDFFIGLIFFSSRLFDADGEGFIRVATFRVRAKEKSTDRENMIIFRLYFKNIGLKKNAFLFMTRLLQIILKEIDETFSEEELDGIISDVSFSNVSGHLLSSGQ